jgi:general secretion pathway protein M
MNVALQPRQHVLASYGILALALVSALLVVLGPPIRGRLEFFTELASLRTTYAKSLAALARSEAVSAVFDQRRVASDPTAQLFHAETAALAGAELQNQLSSLITAEGGTLLSSAFREPAETKPLTPIAVAIRVRCTVASLLKILHGLENRSPALFVENLSIQSNQRTSSSARDLSGNLDVELEVLGFLDPPAAP